MSDNLRDRFKAKSAKPNTPKNKPKNTSGSDSIFGIWDEQRRLKAEDEKIAKELAETKKKTKELQKTLRKNKYGEINSQAGNYSKKVVSETKSFGNRYLRKLLNFVNRNKKATYAAIGVFTVFISVAIVTNLIKPNSNTSTLGESISSDATDNNLPREKPDFKLLYPTGRSSKDYEVVRISPPESAASYTYLDRFTDDGQIFRVSQQEIPENFDLAKTATDFQATSIIQIDDNVIYHGYSEKGGVQSILFVKDDKFVSIRSPQKFSDDTWAGYILSLK